MASDSFIGKVRLFFGLRQEPPKNDFRNPIWGSDDDDDDDELYTRQQLQRVDVYADLDIHREITKHMQDMITSFGGILGDMKSFFHDEHFDAFTNTETHLETEPKTETFNSNNIREHYLKPGYHRKHDQEDMDLDGKISSQEISGLLLKKDSDLSMVPVKPFDGSLVPGMSFCQTIITTSVTKPDGTVETRRIIKKGNDIIEETTTSSGQNPGPHSPGLNTISSSGIIFSEIASLFRNFY